MLNIQLGVNTHMVRSPFVSLADCCPKGNTEKRKFVVTVASGCTLSSTVAVFGVNEPWGAPCTLQTKPFSESWCSMDGCMLYM